MTEYLVTFRVTSEIISLAELSGKLGEAGPNSIDKQLENAREPSAFQKYTEWVIESDADREAILDEHLEAIFEKVPLQKLNDESLPQDLEMFFAIAAFFDDAMCTVHLSPEWLNLLSSSDINLEVSCYPCDFGT